MKNDQQRNSQPASNQDRDPNRQQQGNQHTAGRGQQSAYQANQNQFDGHYGADSNSSVRQQGGYARKVYNNYGMRDSSGHTSSGRTQSGYEARSSAELQDFSRSNSNGQQAGLGDEAHGQHHDPHYQQWRNAHIRDLDNDYDAWRTERYNTFSKEFGEWRNNRQAAQTAGNDAGSKLKGARTKDSSATNSESDTDADTESNADSTSSVKSK